MASLLGLLKERSDELMVTYSPGCSYFPDTSSYVTMDGPIGLTGPEGPSVEPTSPRKKPVTWDGVVIGLCPRSKELADTVMNAVRAYEAEHPDEQIEINAQLSSARVEKELIEDDPALVEERKKRLAKKAAIDQVIAEFTERLKGLGCQVDHMDVIDPPDARLDDSFYRIKLIEDHSMCNVKILCHDRTTLYKFLVDNKLYDRASVFKRL